MNSPASSADNIGGVGRHATVLVAALLVAGAVAAQSPSPSTTAPQSSTKKAAPAKKAVASEFKMVVEPRAMELLKAMSAKLAAAKTMSFTATVGYEYPSKLGPPIVYTTRYDVTMQRPDKLRIIMPGDGPASEFYYDGKAMIAYAPAENLAAVADAPPTIDDTLEAAYKNAGIYFPFTDLIVANPYKDMARGLDLAYYIGQSKVIDGITTDMVAYIDNGVFIQLWIGAEDKLPHRVHAVFLNDPERLRHDLQLSNWRLDGEVAADAFAPASAGSAKRIPFANPHPQAPAKGAVN